MGGTVAQLVTLFPACCGTRRHNVAFAFPVTQATLIPSTLFCHPPIYSHVSDVVPSFQKFSSFLFVLRADPISAKRYILASLHGRVREVRGSNLGIHTANVYGFYSVPPGQDSTSSSRTPPSSTSLPNQHSTVTQHPALHI